MNHLIGQSAGRMCRALVMFLVMHAASSGDLSMVAAGFAGDDQPAALFVQTLSSRPNVPADAAELISDQWAQCDDCDPEEFLTQALAVISEEIRGGLDAYNADDYADAARRMATLTSHNDPFVAVHAAAYEVKALVALEQTIEASQRLNQLLGDGGARVAQYSYFSGEMAFLHGFCLLTDLKYEAAAEAMTAFLREYPEAPARLTLAARQILLELDNRTPKEIGEVVDLMQYSRRRLKNADGGEVVQARQERILELLDRLIEEAEEQEKNSCDSGGGAGNSSGQAPSSPMPDSMLPGGDPSEGTLRAARRANPGEMWGAMPPAERERILQVIRDSFPQRYRKLVEQYYEELAKKP